uniref:Polyketide synthase n=1 Tax=Fusarium sp. NBRC100844 TaxID=1977034 RepID=A0A218PG30_9HYPO|nr:polyketide synthase [Fusarium sp. NBRC100844]
MGATTRPRPAISAAIFSPQSNPPKPSYLAHVRSRLLEEPLLKAIRDAIASLPETLQSLESFQQGIEGLQDGRQRVQNLADWLSTGSSEAIESDMSGLITLPLLTTIQMVQYLDYLQHTSRTHSETLDSLKDGGVQGYCIGLLSAVIVASSTDEQELVQHTATGIRLALAIGAFGDLAELSSTLGWTTLAIRLRQGGEDDEAELLKRFPGTYISTISDPHGRSVIVPDNQVTAFRAFAEAQGLQPKTMHIRGKLHDPNNTKLVKQCIKWSEAVNGLPFPGGESLYVSVRSNRTGECLSDIARSLSSEVIETILASQCDWSHVIRYLASDLQQTRRREHTLGLFGIGNSVPLAPFRHHDLEITKLDVLSITSTTTPPLTSERITSTLDSFPPTAIAVVGAGCRLPGANSLDQLWDLISDGKSRLENLRTDRANLKESYRAGQDKDWASKRSFFGNYIDDVEAFDHSFFGMSPREAKYMDPQQRLLLEAAFDAMDSAGYMRHHVKERNDPVGCFVGASYTEYLENTSAYSPSAFTATGTIRAFLSGKISYHFGWSGPSEVLDTACSASIVAVHRACQAINAGECSMALAGGVNLITGVNNYFDLGKASFLSATGQCKPFDDSADGYCRADGVGLVCLKPLSKAVADGDHIMGVIPATATNQGGNDAAGITVPDGTAQRALYRRVLEKSRIDKDRVAYVEAHGTGTQVGDPIEIKSIREVFGGSTRTSPLYLGSLKGNIGHSETAAGVASLIKVLSMFRHQGIPPLQGFKRLNHKIPPLEADKMVIPTSLVPWDSRLPRVAGINSYGASGSNSALLCSEWRYEMKQPTKVAAFPILLSAHSPESLRRYADDLASFVLKSSPSDLSLGDLAFTLSQRRKHHRVRWSTTATDLPDLVGQLMKQDSSDFVQIPKTPKKVVLAFSGQSRTSIGLDPAVPRSYPVFAKYITQCNDILKSFGCPDILPALSETNPISDPVVLQCGTVAVQYSCAKAWIDGGLKVDAVVGHSLGELTALAVSGALSPSDALKVVYTRAELIKAKWGVERGTMLAIHAPSDVVQSIMEVVNTLASSEDDALEIACFNSLSSHIVVGKQASVALAEKVLQQDPKYQGVRYQRLNVSHGFHSRFTEPLLLDLVELEKTLTFKKPTIALETSTKTPLDFEAKGDRYIANHAREPVYFVDAVHRLEQRLGACVFLESGWGSPIVPMAKKAVVDQKLHTFQPVTSTAVAAANLWKEGIDIAGWSLLTPRESGLKAAWLPPYNFDPTKAWLDHVDHAAEERRMARSQQTARGTTAGNESTQLVSYKGALGSDGSSHAFYLHRTTERFTRIVQGHAVRQKPLCPASMYMEAAIMGLDKLGTELRGKTISFQNIVFPRPLGCGESLDVELCLSQTSRSAAVESWHYAVQNATKSAYSEGDFSISASPHADLDLYGLLVSDGIAALKQDPDTEKLKKATAYALFSRIVEYSDLMRGITSITLGQKQALATIQVPNAAFASSESTVTDCFDAISLDTFIQVLGLLINCNNASDSGDEIYIASCINKMVISPTEFSKAQTWTVYATYSASDGKTLSGSVFVYSEDGNLAAFGTKIQFMRTQAARLERVLEAANPRPSTAPAQASVLPTTSGLRPDLGTANPGVNVQAAPPAAEADTSKVDVLKSLISAYSGIKESEIQNDVSFGSMGLDSLASMELASEIESTLGIQVNAEDLLTGDVNTLLKLFPSNEGAQLKPKAVEFDSRSSVASSDSQDSSSDGDNDDPTAMSTPPDYGFQSSPNDSLGKSRPWTKPNAPLNSRFKIETVVYKEVEGVEIPADLYVPSEPRSQPMPIALMIHGGGHLTLSRRAVRPPQTRFLMEMGLFPVSVDYRLAPQVNVLDGSMTDVRDACIWARQDLPKIMALKGFTIDPTKLVVIGWSTGGTLAMTTSWTLPELGHSPPLAVLSFYCPVDYQPDAPITMGQDHASRTMSFSQIRKLLPAATATSHAFNSLDTTKLGWLSEGDPRSELVLALVKEKNGMSLLFNGMPDGEELPRANADRAAAFSPLNQVRRGNYHTPTYLIFGDEDEIAPFSKAVEFEQALIEKDVLCGFLPVTGAKHIFDLGLTPGSDGWEIGVGPGYDFLVRQIENAHRGK